jgi:hypothetical protein
MRALLVVMALAGSARADRIPAGGAWLHYELSGASDGDGVRPHELVLAGARLHGFIGGDTLVFHGGIDLAAGSTLRAAGFAYDVALFPIGAGLRLGKTGFFTVGAGIGEMGAVGTLEHQFGLPLEANLEVGSSWRLLARGRWSPIGKNEVDATVGLRIGSHYEDYVPSGNGYFVGATYRELFGVNYVGGVIGYSIDLAAGR